MAEHLTKKDLYARFLESASLIRFLGLSELPRSVSGLPGGLRAFFLKALRGSGSQMLYLAKDSEEVERLLFDLEGIDRTGIVAIRRIESLNLLRLPSGAPRLILCPAELSEQSMGWREERASIYFEPSGEVELEATLDWLAENGFGRETLLTEPAEFAQRGGILDVFSPLWSEPVRIEFEGDRVVSIRRFDPLTQRSHEKLSSVEIVSNKPPDSQGPTLREYLKDSLTISALPEASPRLLITDKAAEFAPQEGHFDFGFTPAVKVLGHFEELRELESQGLELCFVLDPEHGESYLSHHLERFKLVDAHLSGGWVDRATGYGVFTEHELFGVRHRRRLPRHFKGIPSDAIYELHPGDYVVHIDYGIGIYQGLKRLEIGGQEKEFLKISYAGTDVLYLPVENLGLLDRYIGAEGRAPRVNRLGSQRWRLARKHARKAAYDYAQELLALYAKRSVVRGHAFSRHPEEMEWIELTFPYEETPDQKRAIESILADMETPNPMDRLVCGEVGYGKTEVAVRAALKAALDSKQVAMMAPTTILALQHYRTFTERLKELPIRVQMLSRFVGLAERRKTLAELAEGKVDVLIGTHALLAEAVKWNDLGLLVVDDEHRFGVRQKEKIRRKKAEIDTLTLTATPIPRTLYMSLVGIRDVSRIETPPVGRKDVVTEVSNWSDDMVREWVLRERSRGGLVLFIHNRIETIESLRRRLERLLPGLRLEVAHGQMPERKLVSIYDSFIERKIDILISTAILEAGIDIPDLNTIIVDRADLFGLADLHQLRGRVGRSQRQGYALFIVPRRTTDEAKKRLAAIRAYAELGAGYRLAVRDMEIRGVGNLLGTEQHGHVNSIGFMLYTKLLSEAVARLKGEEWFTEPVLEIEHGAYLPETYIGDSAERVSLYKRLLSVEEEREIDALHEELADRFGKMPSSALKILDIARVRALARKKKVSKVSYRKDSWFILAADRTLRGTGPFEMLLDQLRRL
ncbi:MAG: transcription-repair coupling factor [Candidatus Stahlbacteria bacterium]|nr:MAG: transcription-repair coupling factor [Candidatus Stahlbacteria bacterium]